MLTVVLWRHHPLRTGNGPAAPGAGRGNVMLPAVARDDPVRIARERSRHAACHRSGVVEAAVAR